MDRTGTGTRAIFGQTIRFDLSKGFPATTTKKLAWKSVVSELLWFLEGSSDERRLAELRYGKDRKELVGLPTIWTANADNQGKALRYANGDLCKELGPIYGVQWREWQIPDWDDERGFSWQVVDQIVELIANLKRDPAGRRHIVSAWNVGKIHEMTLPPCHYGFQCYVRNGKLSLLWNQRSVDSFLGLAFNIASYALLTHLIARECGFAVGELIGMLGDTHIYHNHFDQVTEQINREPFALPTLEIDPNFSLLSVLTEGGARLSEVDMFKLIGYEHHPELKAPMAV
jgi:thymidylate synthase